MLSEKDQRAVDAIMKAKWDFFQALVPDITDEELLDAVTQVLRESPEGPLSLDEATRLIAQKLEVEI